MELFATNSFIPIQTEGKGLDLEYSVTNQVLADAFKLYDTASRRLLCPFLWHNLSGTGTAEFTIYDEGRNNSRLVNVEDHLFIDIPGTGTESHDWVIVEDIQQGVVMQANDSMGIKLRACGDPNNAEDKTSHFFTESATSTLIIVRNENVVTASYHGRNEKPNLETGNTLENIRNGVVALGALIGLSKLQWTSLLKGLLS